MAIKYREMTLEELLVIRDEVEQAIAEKIEARRSELVAELAKLDGIPSGKRAGKVSSAHPNAGKTPEAKWKWAGGEWSGRGQISNKMWDALGVAAGSISREDALKLAEKKGMKV